MSSESDSPQYIRFEALVSELRSELSFLAMGGLSRLGTSERLLDNLIARMSDANWAEMEDAHELSMLRQTLSALQHELAHLRMALQSIQRIVPAMIVPSSLSTQELLESVLIPPTEIPGA
jgi:chromosome segregation ATPase